MFSENVRRFSLLLLATPLPVICQSHTEYDRKKCDEARTLPWSQVETEVLQKGAVKVPPLAKAVGVREKVRVEVCVSEDGDVVLTKPMGGSPILDSAAVESAKGWHFKLGRETPFKTILEIDFTGGASPNEIASEQETNNRYFEEDSKCRQKYHDKALVLCKGALDLVEKLPKERTNERRLAHQILGHVYFAQRMLEDALKEYRSELQISLDSLQPYEAELAYAYHDVALASHALGKVADAEENYTKAETTMLLARDHITMDGLKVKYSETLRQIREHHLLLLRQTGEGGRTSFAAEEDRRI